MGAPSPEELGEPFSFLPKRGLGSAFFVAAPERMGLPANIEKRPPDIEPTFRIHPVDGCSSRP